MMEIELVLDARANLGEGPVWDDRSGVLMCVAALRDGIAVIEDDGALRFVSDIEKDVPANRFNDAKCDSAGRFWAGTMALDVTPGAAALYRIDPDGTATAMVRDVTLSNGLAWSPDDSTMYYIDSLTYGLDAFDFDAASGTVSNRRRLITCDPQADGLPDGMTVDAEGYLWIAFYAGGAVRRYGPDGTLDHVLELPFSQPTCVTFGGGDLGDLYITTANQLKSPDELAAEPTLGGLFRARPGVTGLPASAFAG